MLIQSLSLKDFKCFEQVDIDFGKITLLTGANSSGKSSLINALLGIMQSKYFPLYFALNGDLVNMGGFDDVLRKKAKNKTFGIDISLGYKLEPEFYKTTWQQNDENEQPELKKIINNRYSFEDIENNKGTLIQVVTSEDFHSIERKYKDSIQIINQDSDLTTIIHREPRDVSDMSFHKTRFPELVDEDDYFNYIGSFRLPPERTYYRKPKAGKVSANGEGYIDQIIEWFESDKKQHDSLIQAVNEIGIFKSIHSNRMKGGRFELNVKVNENSELASLTDVGFGISQFLPIIVADLQLGDNSCLAISQPEIHLHPKIQATLADYICKQINAQDRQYIVETHSEYLINRMRLLIVKGELKPEDVKLYYMENDGTKTTTYPIELTTDGQIKNAPQGFFDTYEMDVMDIALFASTR